MAHALTAKIRAASTARSTERATDIDEAVEQSVVLIERATELLADLNAVVNRDADILGAERPSTRKKKSR